MKGFVSKITQLGVQLYSQEQIIISENNLWRLGGVKSNCFD
jgi:hypothetical protein